MNDIGVAVEHADSHRLVAIPWRIVDKVTHGIGLAHALHIQGQFLATQTQVQSILWDDDEDGQRLHISVASAGDFDLNKLAQISELVEHVVSGEITPDIGLNHIRAIKRAGPEYGPAINAMAFVLCGLGFGVILGIPWLDVLLGGALGIVSFILTRLAMRSRGLKSTLEVLVAGMSALLATLLAHILPISNPLAVAGLQSTTQVFVLIASILGGLLCGDTVWIINRAAISTVTSRFSRIFRKNQDINE